MDHARFCRGLVFRGVPGINTAIIRAVPALCEGAPFVAKTACPVALVGSATDNLHPSMCSRSMRQHLGFGAARGGFEARRSTPQHRNFFQGTAHACPPTPTLTSRTVCPQSRWRVRPRGTEARHRRCTALDEGDGCSRPPTNPYRTPPAPDPLPNAPFEHSPGCPPPPPFRKKHGPPSASGPSSQKKNHGPGGWGVKSGRRCSALVVLREGGPGPRSPRVPAVDDPPTVLLRDFKEHHISISRPPLTAPPPPPIPGLDSPRDMGTTVSTFSPPPPQSALPHSTAHRVYYTVQHQPFFRGQVFFFIVQKPGLGLVALCIQPPSVPLQLPSVTLQPPSVTI